MHTKVKYKPIKCDDFNTSVDMIPKGKYTKFLKEIKTVMGWKGRTFYNKYQGKGELTIPESVLARVIFPKYGVDIDNQKYI